MPIDRTSSVGFTPGRSGRGPGRARASEPARGFPLAAAVGATAKERRPFAPPGPPTATNSGSISALATVSVQEVPEPSTLALAGLCALLGAGWYYRRARGRALAFDIA